MFFVCWTKFFLCFLQLYKEEKFSTEDFIMFIYEEDLYRITPKTKNQKKKMRGIRANNAGPIGTTKENKMALLGLARAC